jgi:hypothetical protein
MYYLNNIIDIDDDMSSQYVTCASFNPLYGKGYNLVFYDESGVYENSKEIFISRNELNRDIKSILDKRLCSHKYTGVVDNGIVIVPKSYYELYKYLESPINLRNIDEGYDKYKILTLSYLHEYAYFYQGKVLTLYDILVNHKEMYSLYENYVIVWNNDLACFKGYNIKDIAFKRRLTKEIIVRGIN